jgi:hypothetical protein
MISFLKYNTVNRGMKKIYIYLLVIFICVLIFLSAYVEEKEYFTDKKGIQSILNRSAGFYSMLFFTLNHYLYCKKNSLNFKIKSEDWLYKTDSGWTDYFKNTEINFNENTEFENKTHGDVIEEYPIKDYIDAINQVYIYNDRTIEEINNVKNKFNLVNGMYDSIFIRRGDKLAGEATIILEGEYMKTLLSKKSNCSVVFLQTDDYNCFLSLQKYIKENNLEITLYTLCEEANSGTIVHNIQKNSLNNMANNSGHANKEYVSSILDKIDKTKAVEDMNKDEIYKHTLDMIIGIDILINSNICISDYQSNVGRFIKLAHKNRNNVYNVLDPNNDINYDTKKCPAHSF